MNNHDHNEGKLISKENNMEIRINNDQESKINPSPSEQEVKNDQVNVEQKVHIKEDNENELTAESESSILNKNKRNGKKTRRHIMIEEKLKGLTKRSLFDTDGDISSHNILEPENGALRATRQSRKRKASDDDLHSKIHQPSSSSSSQSSRNQQTLFKKGKSNNNNNSTVRKISMNPSTSNQRKNKNKVGNDHDISNTSSSSSSLMGPSLQKQNKRLPTAAENAAALMQQRKESVNLLRPAPKTSVDRLRNEEIRDRELELQRILAHHDTMIRELAHLEVYQTILDYQPTFLNNDERVKKFILEYNLWDLANEFLLNKQRSSPGIRTRHIQGQKLPLIKMLQHSTELDALTGFTETKSNIPNDTQRQILLQSLPPAAVNTIKSGTGIRRINRQFPTLDDYLASFTYLDDTDDATNEDIKEYIEREQSIRDRIRELEGNGGFTITTSKLKEIANKRPQLESIPTAESAAAGDNLEEKDELSTHDLIISQAIASSKLFRGHTKYRKNAARKCAKAIEKYWENIRTREERLQRQESKRIIRLAKWTAQQVKSKWRVVERICEARYKEIVKEQQAKKSRRHLEMILEHSEQMLGVRKDELAQHHSTISENDDNDDSISEGVCNTGSAVEDDNNNFGMDPPPLLTEDDTNASELEQLNSFDEWSESMIDKDGNSTSSGQGSVLGLEDEDERDHFIDESDDVEDSEDDVEDLKQDQNLTVEELYEKYKALYNKNSITGDQRDNENEKEQEEQEEQEEDEEEEEEKEKTNDTSSSNNKVDDNSVENDNVLISNTSDEYEEVESANHNTQLAVLTTEIFDNEDNHGNSDDDDGVADSEYSESDEENRDDFIISDNSESEDDNEALLSLEANAQLSIDDLRAQYESMVKKIEHDTTSTMQTTADVLENGNNTSEQNATSFILEPISLENVDDKSNMNKIGKHSIEVSDNEQITTSSFSTSKKRKLDTLSDKTIQHNDISEIDDTTVLGENTNYNLEDSINNNENDDDDDRTVTDYGSEPPDDDDNNDSDVNHKNTLIINETPEIPKENGINNSNDNDISNDHGDDKLIDDTSNQQMELQHSENESVSKNKHIPVSNPEVNNDYESINMTDTENDNNDIESTDKTYESSAYETESEKQQQQQATVLPTGTTLSTTNVSTRVPFLLRGTLREYQHVGLDWLVSLYNNGLNGILADEMGLGKTIQTIALLASLACEKGIWGPHLVVVPTSVLLNWEMEFKRWLPGFKILTYYGNPKERKEKRVGWSKENAFHVCITSYQLVIQDQSAFKRKPWQYLILDEAHHIKNFRSQRWQVLLNFNSKRRLLLTGTPLQNNLMELWSLLYFLMPNGISSAMPIGFANLREFQEWFSNPVDLMIEGEEGMTEESRNAIQKLHTVLRPYLLRRLKLDVERQMPAKYEHVMYCKLSKRQRYLYDDFMGRAKTKETLASGNFLSIINALMQLRKVCNHPDLFEERPIVTSFCMTNTIQEQGKMLEKWVLCRWNIYSNDIDKINLETSHDLVFVQPALEMTTSQLVANDYTSLDCSKQIIKTIQKIQTQVATNGIHSRSIQSGKKYVDLKTHHQAYLLQQQLATAQRWQSILNRNQQRCEKRPLYGIGLIEKCQQLFAKPFHIKFFPTPENNYHLDAVTYPNRSDIIRDCVLSYENRIQRYMDIIKYYTFVTPAAIVQSVPILTPTSFIPLNYNKNFNINNNTNNSNVYYHNHHQQQQPLSLTLSSSTSSAYINNSNNINYIKDIFHPISSRLKIAFPDKRLLQYDCGKLQRLATLLQDLSAGEHRALIFTQMTKVLDILESFLNMHGYRYLRLDGATKVEQRQVLTERFNNDKRITCFILSTRSGGLGINLTGADTVIFYDSDWNPSMDKQCQDRAHRIGQVRDVHIYRFVTEYTIEETIFKKANQKRLLDDMVIQEGGFTNDYFQKMDWWRDLPEIAGNIGSRRSENKEESIIEETQESNNIDMERALLEAEGDEIDAQAAIAARNEMIMDDHDFDDSIQSTPKLSSSTQYNNNSSLSSSIANSPKNISALSNRSTPQLPPSSPSSASLSPSFPHQASSPILSSYETTIVTPTPTLNKNDDANELSIMSHINNNNDDEYNNNEFDEHMEVGHVDQYMLRFWEREIFGDYLGFGGLPKPVDFE